MTKTLDDYLNDPDLINEPESLREVHAIRLKIHDETKGMTAAEYNAIVHERAERFFATDAVEARRDLSKAPHF
jgi:hypothetical protein